MSIRGRCILLVGGIAVFVALGTVYVVHHGTFREAEGQPHPVDVSLVAQWEQVGLREALPQPVVDSVSRLVGQALLKQGYEESFVPSIDLRPSLQAFIEQFRTTLISPEFSEGTSYFLAWLILEAFQREPVDPAALAQACDQFSIFLDRFSQEVRELLAQYLGRHLGEHERAIDKGIREMKEEALSGFRELQADPLFPAYKAPLEEEVASVVIDEVAWGGFMTSLFDSPGRMMEWQKDKDAWKLRVYFRDSPQMILHVIAFRSQYGRLWDNPYWDKMNFSCGTTRRGEFWPWIVKFLPASMKSRQQ